MKILSPISRVSEAQPLVDAGAGEFYCGVLTQEWKDSFTNIGSISRREWSISSMETYGELAEVVKIAHAGGVKVFVALNALYTEGQYEQLNRNLDEIFKIDVDAVIVADLGLLLLLKERGWSREIHISTGGVTFNSRTARFYHDLGASRIIIPRHNTADEIVTLARAIDFMDTECFIMNSGCKNIDGFCTYLHGVNEILHKGSWNLPKKLGLDFFVYRNMRRLPQDFARSVARGMNLKTDSVCLLTYDVEVEPVGDVPPKKVEAAKKWLSSTFTFYSGLDPCGACELKRFREAGIKSVKIVGRENPTHKKVRDVTYLRRALDFLEQKNPAQEEYAAFCKKEYEKIYGVPCQSWCYYPRVERAGENVRM